MNVDQIDEKIRIRTEEKSQLLQRVKNVRGWQVYGQNQDRICEINEELEQLKADREQAVGKTLERAIRG